MLFKLLKSIFLSLLFLSVLVHSQNKKVGVVLSGGGAKGFAHIGVLKVLHDNNIPIDYIGGTSIGALVGGLYALGYTPQELDSMAQVNDWQFLLNDKVERKKSHPIQRNIDENYFVHLPFNRKTISVPSGLKSGQEIHHLISKLYYPYSSQKDFSKFQTPFLCVATNIENGKQVVLKEGYLPDALRASMAIPSYFTPVEINNNLLLDGGLVNNFPVKEIKDYGAEIIIGVDVQTSLYEKEELNSLIKIMAQAVFFNSEEKYQENIKLCDFLIQPEIGVYDATSFDPSAIDSLIKIGEKAALKALPLIQQKITSVPTPVIKKVNSDTTYYIKNIKITGSNKINPKALKSYFKIKKNPQLSETDIIKQIERIDARGLFKSVNYEIITHPTYNELVLKVAEKEPGEINLGLHFDNEMNACVLANLTLRSLVFRGASWSTNIRGALQPRIKSTLSFEAPIIGGIEFNATYQQLEFNNYFNNVKISDYNFEFFSGAGLLKAKIKNFLFLKGGLEYERAPISTKYAFLKSVVDTNNRTFYQLDEVIVDSTSYSFNYALYLELDSRNHKYFASEGWYLNAFYKYLNPISQGELRLDQNATSFRGDVRAYLPILKNKWSWSFGGGVAYNTRNVPLHYKMQLGGQMDIQQTQFHNVYGLQRGQINLDNGAQYYMNVDVGTQVQFSKNHFFKLNTSLLMYNSDDIFELDWNKGWNRSGLPDGYLGYSLVNYAFTYGYNSPVGPLQISVVENRLDHRVWVFLNLGFFL